MSAPKTKAQLNTLIEGYIADESPNIRASEHKEIELAILDRVDARILHVGTFSYTEQQMRQANGIIRNLSVSFGKTLYTSNYLVSITPFTKPYATRAQHNNWIPSYRATTSVTNKSTTGFTALIKQNYAYGPGKFIYVIVNLANDI
jgi:hypothetical protein